MSYLTLIINPDQVQREAVKTFLTTMADFECVELPDEAKAISWMVQNRRPVDFIFSSWDLNYINQNIIKDLRENEFAKNALIYPMASQEDLEWIKTIFGSAELIDNILIKPFRAQAFGQRVQHILKAKIESKPAVLLVEDNEEARETVRGYLKQFGFTEIYEAANGKEGLSLLESHQSAIALIVSDWEMPLMNGLQFLKKVRENERFATIPFVMVTSQTSIEQIKMIQAAEYGVNGYLQKPFRLQIFKAEMDQILSEMQKAKSADAYVVEAKTLMASGNVAEAVRVLAEASLKISNSGVLWEALGDAYAQSHSNNSTQNYRLRSVEAYEKALKCPSVKKGVVVKCFEGYASLGRMNDAIRILKTQLEGKGFDDELRTHLAKIYLRTGDYDSATKELKRALKINNENNEAQSLYQVATSLNQKVAKG